jgi:hypothetical protein
MTDVLDVLIAARAEVAKGWAKGADYAGWTSSEGGVCAMGGIYRSAKTDECRYADLYGAAASALAPHVPADFECAYYSGPAMVGEFNDHPSTTKADVLALFDRAIAAEAVKTSPDTAHVHAVQA